MKSRRQILKEISELKKIASQERSGARFILPDNQRTYNGSGLGRFGNVIVLPPDRTHQAKNEGR